MKRWHKIVLGGVALFAVIQLVPYGRAHDNPPIKGEPAWDSPQTRALAVRACFDCHANTTTWPWYSHIAPVSWLVQHDVDEGRGDLDFTEWDPGKPQRRARKAAGEVDEGDMPPFYYVWMHPDAKLSPDEKAALIKGLRATFGQ
jgi:hypothetical protein